MTYLPSIVGLPDGPGFPLAGGDLRVIGWYREQWARERWRAFCAIWLHVGLAEAQKQAHEKAIDCALDVIVRNKAPGVSLPPRVDFIDDLAHCPHRWCSAPINRSDVSDTDAPGVVVCRYCGGWMHWPRSEDK